MFDKFFLVWFLLVIIEVVINEVSIKLVLKKWLIYLFIVYFSVMIGLLVILFGCFKLSRWSMVGVMLFNVLLLCGVVLWLI